MYFVIDGVNVGIENFVKFLKYGVEGEKMKMRISGEMFKEMVRKEVEWFEIK